MRCDNTSTKQVKGYLVGKEIKFISYSRIVSPFQYFIFFFNLVGDSSGDIHSLKLSPNLRKQTREVKIALAAKDFKRAGELEVKKLVNILGQVRDQQTRNNDDLDRILSKEM